MSRVMQRAHVELHESLEKERKEAHVSDRKLSEIQTKCDLKQGVAVERANVQFMF